MTNMGISEHTDNGSFPSIKSINSRPSPEKCAISCLREEHSENMKLMKEYMGMVDPDKIETLHNRTSRIDEILESRLGIKYPHCPTCNSTEWYKEIEGWTKCIECGYTPRKTGEILSKIKSEWTRLLTHPSE